MRVLLMFGLALSLTAMSVGEEKKKPLDPEKLVGDWKIASGERNGTKSGEPFVGSSVKITKQTITTGEGEMSFEFKYTIDAKAEPATIDLEITKGPDGAAGAKAKGIIAIEDGQIKFCYTTTGDRPSKFSGEKANLYVLKKK